MDTILVRWAARALGFGVLFCVLLGAISLGADAPAPADQPALDAPASESSSPATEITVPPTEQLPAAESLEANSASVASTPAPATIDDRISVLMAEGIEAWRYGDHAGAEKIFADALSLDVPVELKRPLLLEMARRYEEKENHLKAIAVLEKFRKSLPADRELPQILMRLGLLYRETGAYGAATARFFQVLNSTLRVSTEDLDRNRRLAMKARLEIADTFMLQGNSAEAQNYYSRLQLLDLEPADRERVQFRGAQLQHALHEWLPAERELGAFLAAYPQSGFAAEARYLRAKALKELGRRDEAVEEVLTLLRSQEAPDAAAIQTAAYWKRRTGNELANNFYEQGDFLGALSIYQALAKASEDPAWRWPAIYQVGLCFERLHLPQRAAEAYQVIVTPDPAPAADAKLSDTLVSLQTMAQWRLGHLVWVEDFEKKLQIVTSGQTADA